MQTLVAWLLWLFDDDDDGRHPVLVSVKIEKLSGMSFYNKLLQSPSRENGEGNFVRAWGFYRWCLYGSDVYGMDDVGGEEKRREKDAPEIGGNDEMDVRRKKSGKGNEERADEGSGEPKEEKTGGREKSREGAKVTGKKLRRKEGGREKRREGGCCQSKSEESRREKGYVRSSKDKKKYYTQ
ncbi:hypothetical protein Tco_1275709 [Tanacetum coccineum]